MRRRAALAAAAGMAWACSKGQPAVMPDGVSPIERMAVPGEALRGLSGLTRMPDEAGTDGFRVLSVGERVHQLIPLRIVDGTVAAGAPIPVRGVTKGLDLEGLTFIPPDTVVFSTEANTRRDADLVLWAQLEARRAVVFETVSFPYDLWGMTPDRNRGLEGICSAGRRLVAASEMAREDRDGRWSPVGVWDPQAKTWLPVRVRLRTKTGKLSGLSCRLQGSTMEITAIERHFDVFRLVRFELDLEALGRGPPPLVATEPLADLRPRFARTPPNFEGLARRPDGGFVLITDNDWRGVQGPTEVILWPDGQ